MNNQNSKEFGAQTSMKDAAASCTCGASCSCKSANGLGCSSCSCQPADEGNCKTCGSALKSGIKYQNICTVCQPIYKGRCSGCQHLLWDCMCIRPHTWE